jgi:hypothetical protein
LTLCVTSSLLRQRMKGLLGGGADWLALNTELADR